MKKQLSYFLFFTILISFFSGCNTNKQSTSKPSVSPITPFSSVSSSTNTSSVESIVMFDAQDLPATVRVKDFGYNFEHDITIKGLLIREKTSVEKERSKSDLGYIAILQYQAKSLNDKVSNEVTLSEEFSLVVGDRIIDSAVRAIVPNDADYKTDNPEGLYEGYKIFEIDEATAQSPYLQIRFVAKSIGEAVEPIYFNVK